MTRIEEIEAREKAATPVESMDDYVTAAQYLMRKAMRDGDGFMLRAIKTLMDAVEEARGKLEAVEELPEGWHRNYQPTAGDKWWIEQLDRILHPQEAE